MALSGGVVETPRWLLSSQLSTTYTHLSADTSVGAVLVLEYVNNAHGRDIPATRDVIFHAKRLLIDEAREKLDTAAASKAADYRLSDPMGAVTHNFHVAIRAALAKPLVKFATSRHIASEVRGGNRSDELEEIWNNFTKSEID